MFVDDLAEYMQTRDRRFHPRKWDLIRQAVEAFPAVDFDTWAFLYNAAFSLAWQLQDNFKQDQHNILERIIRPARRLFEKAPLAGGPHTAWLLNNATRGMYAPYKHVEGFLAGQRPCFVYVFSKADPEVVADLEAMGHKVRVFEGTQTDIVAQIRLSCEIDKIGALIAETYTSVPMALFSMRTAPLQVYLSPGFQLFPADVTLVPETQDVMTSPFEIVPSPMRHETLFRKIEPTPRKHPLIFGCLSRYEKMSREYLEVVGQILDKTGGVFMAFGRGTLPKIHDKIIACGIERPEVALGSMDVYLDTFPLCGGVSVWEAMAAQIPVISREDASVRSWNSFKPYVTRSTELYIDAAVEVSGETPLREIIIREGLSQAKKFVEVEKAGRKLDEIIDTWRLRTTPSSRQQYRTG